MSRYVGVKGNRHLVKDLRSNAVININNSEIEQAKERKRRTLEKKQQLETLEQDVAGLKDDMVEIKSLLKSLLEKQ